MLSAATSQTVADHGWLYDLLRWAGVSDPTAAHWQQVVIKPVTVLVIVVVSSLVGWLGNRVIRRWVGAVANKAVARAESPRATARAATITALMANIWRGVIVVIAFFVILGTIGLNLTPLLAGATVIGATLGFGAQSMVRDLLSGFLLIVEGQYDIGDTVMVGDTTGTIEDLTLRVTRLRGADGTLWFVPNGEIRKLANQSRGWALATVDVPVPASADVDVVLREVREAAEAVVRGPSLASCCLEPPTSWGVVAAAADTFTTRVSVRTTLSERDRVRRGMLEEIVRRLHGAGVFALTAASPADGPPVATQADDA